MMMPTIPSNCTLANLMMMPTIPSANNGNKINPSNNKNESDEEE
jgi:hypothetical protein